MKIKIATFLLYGAVYQLKILCSNAFSTKTIFDRIKKNNQANAVRNLILTSLDHVIDESECVITDKNNVIRPLPQTDNTRDDIPPEDFREFTEILLDKEKYPPGSLKQEILDGGIHVLVGWGKTGTVEGAQRVEEILERLEEEAKIVRYYQNEITNRHYTVAIDAWGKSGHANAAKIAEKILNKMEDMSKKNPLRAPNRITYNAVMNAYARQNSAEDAERILEKMENNPELQPITNDYNALLGAFARLGEAREVEKVMKRMVDRCKEIKCDPCDCAPDLISYNMLLDAWSKSGERGAGKRAEAILEALEVQGKTEDPAMTPDERSYSAVICAVIRSDARNAVEKVETIFKRAEANGIIPDAYLCSALLDAYASSRKPGMAAKAEMVLRRMEQEGVANSVSYNTVIKAWKESNNEDAPQRAEAILERMEELGFADTISYSTVIAAYAKKAAYVKGDKNDLAQRADEICRKMQKFTQKGAVDMKPNIQTYNAVMNAWVQSGNVYRAEEILDNLEKRYENELDDVMPNVVSYSTVMNGWAKSNQENAVEKTEELFRRMTKMYESSGDEEARPNLISFVTLINSIVKSRNPGSAAKAEEMIYRMYAEYEKGNFDVKPNTKLITSVIHCWQRSGETNAGERAEGLLQWMIDIYGKEKDENLRPNEFTFNSVISAWGKSRAFGKASKARGVLDQMTQLNDSGELDVVPNTHCYTAVINSCAYCANDTMEKRDALQIALKTYKESLGQSDVSRRPNQVTFATMMTALQKLLPPGEQRDAAIKSIFTRCCMDGLVDATTVNRLELILPEDQLRDIFTDAVGGKGRFVDIRSLPDDWTRNAYSRRRRTNRSD